jgi:hypothetical protein
MFSLVAFGANDKGQCNVPSGTFQKIALGQDFGIGLRTDGTLIGWGDNTYGQVSAVPTGMFTGITAGKDYAFAYSSTQIIGWGNPQNYEIPQDLWGLQFPQLVETSGATTCLVYVSNF